MGVQWTKEQQEVIRLRDRNILVSAAAGSGKTAVLVERILSKITDNWLKIRIMSICRDRQPCFILHRLQRLMVSVPILSGITFI